jgi:hypothetical protein
MHTPGGCGGAVLAAMRYVSAMECGGRASAFELRRKNANAVVSPRD